MDLRRKILTGLAGIVLAGGVGLCIKSAYESKINSKEDNSEKQDNSPWMTREEFEGFTYVSPDTKMTREELKEHLHSLTPGPDKEDNNYSINGIPTPKRRRLVNEGFYKGGYSGITREGNNYTLIITENNKDIQPLRYLSVTYFEDGSSCLNRREGIKYNEEDLKTIIERYKSEITK